MHHDVGKWEEKYFKNSNNFLLFLIIIHHCNNTHTLWNTEENSPMYGREGFKNSSSANYYSTHPLVA